MPGCRWRAVRRVKLIFIVRLPGQVDHIMHCLQIPDDAFNALKLPAGRAEQELHCEFAIFLVKEGLLEPTQARTIANMDRVAFQTLLAQRRVAWGGSPEEALTDMQAAQASARSKQR